MVHDKISCEEEESNDVPLFRTRMKPEAENSPKNLIRMSSDTQDVQVLSSQLLQRKPECVDPAVGKAATQAAGRLPARHQRNPRPLHVSWPQSSVFPSEVPVGLHRMHLHTRGTEEYVDLISTDTQILS